MIANKSSCLKLNRNSMHTHFDDVTVEIRRENGVGSGKSVPVCSQVSGNISMILKISGYSEHDTSYILTQTIRSSWN